MSALAKTTFVSKQKNNNALTDYEKVTKTYSIFCEKSQRTSVASLYDLFVFMKHLLLLVDENNIKPIYVDRFCFCGSIYEMIWESKSKEDRLISINERKELLQDIYSMCKKLNMDGIFLVNSNFEQQLKINQARGDFMDRDFKMEYIIAQYEIFTEIGRALNIPVYDYHMFLKGEYNNDQNIELLREIWTLSFNNYMQSL